MQLSAVSLQVRSTTRLPASRPAAKHCGAEHELMGKTEHKKAAAGGRGRTPADAPQARLREILTILGQTFPDAHCELDFSTPLDLLVATILSAQCTDARVNQVTASLFKKYRSAADYAAADQATFEQEIRSTGFFHNKAKNILACCQHLVRDFGGQVPRSMEELVSLPRRRAQDRQHPAVQRVRGIPGFGVDTHVVRVTNRLGPGGHRGSGEDRGSPSVDSCRWTSGASPHISSSFTAAACATPSSRPAPDVHSMPCARGPKNDEVVCSACLSVHNPCRSHLHAGCNSGPHGVWSRGRALRLQPRPSLHTPPSSRSLTGRKLAV